MRVGAQAFIRTYDAPVGTWVSHFGGDVVLLYVCEDSGGPSFINLQQHQANPYYQHYTVG